MEEVDGEEHPLVGVTDEWLQLKESLVNAAKETDLILLEASKASAEKLQPYAKELVLSYRNCADYCTTMAQSKRNIARQLIE